MKNIICLFIVLIVSCSSEKNRGILTSNYGYTQGTTYSIRYISTDGKNMQNDIDSILFDVDQSLSTYIKESVISKINRNEINKLDSFCLIVLESALDIANKTVGAFDPTVAAVVNFWGFGFEEIKVKNETNLSHILNTVGFDKIHINGDKIVKENPKTQLDFNGIAQGFTVDIIADHFQKIGIKNYMIEIGGELRCKGRNAEKELWRIGIEKPEQKRNEDHFQAILAIEDLAVASSGNYRKYKIDSLSGVRYSHSINPKTGQPVQSNLLSVTIINPSCMVADALATACMIMGLDKSIEYINQDSDTEAMIIYSRPNGDLEIFQTEALKKMSIYSSQVQK